MDDICNICSAKVIISCITYLLIIVLNHNFRNHLVNVKYEYALVTDFFLIFFVDRDTFLKNFGGGIMSWWLLVFFD